MARRGAALLNVNKMSCQPEIPRSLGTQKIESMQEMLFHSSSLIFMKPELAIECFKRKTSFGFGFEIF